MKNLETDQTDQTDLITLGIPKECKGRCSECELNCDYISAFPELLYDD